MVRVNILYADNIEDADIILVPENIAQNIEFFTQKFFDWVYANENQKLFQKTDSLGRVYVSIGTQDFIWWLNEYEISTIPYASIVKEHTTCCPNYPTAQF